MKYIPSLPVIPAENVLWVGFFWGGAVIPPNSFGVWKPHGIYCICHVCSHIQLGISYIYSKHKTDDSFTYLCLL